MNIPEIAKCIFCDASGELLPDWDEHDRKVKHPDDHRKPWERCPLTGMIVELHWWNRRQPTPEAAETSQVQRASELEEWVLKHPADAAFELGNYRYELERLRLLAHPPKPEPTEAHSKSEFKRLSVLGANVVPPKPTKAMLDITDLMATDVRRASAPKPPAEWMAQLNELHAWLREQVTVLALNPHSDMRIGEAYDEAANRLQAIIARHYSAPAEGWQPIETGPKGGIKVQLFWDGKVTLGFYLDNSKSEYPWKGWRQLSGEVMLPGKPTLWQPLAAAPKEGK